MFKVWSRTLGVIHAVFAAELGWAVFIGGDSCAIWRGWRDGL